MKRNMTRHTFLKVTVLATVAAFFLANVSFGQGTVWYQTLDEALQVIVFDPTTKGNEYFIVLADTHRPQNYNRLPQMIERWNTMTVRPAFVTILGDMISSASVSFGHIPDARGIQTAREEYKVLMSEMSQLSPEIKFAPVIGNHDTHPGEEEAELFREAFPDHEPYGAFEHNGMHILRWKGGAFAHLSETQLEWMRRYLADVPRDATVVVLVHQPGLGGVVRERGVPSAVRELFADFTGNLWLLAGHEHNNVITVFQLPKTTIAQCTHYGLPIEGRFHSGEAYWIYCTRNGEIVARIFCDLDQGFRVGPMPDRSRTQPIPVPFGGRDDLLWSMLIGEEKEGESAFVSNDGGANCQYFWFYVGKELIYRLPLDKTGNEAIRFAVLGNFFGHRETREPIRVFASGNGEDWVETPIVETVNSVNAFTIPEPLRSGNQLYVKIVGFGFGSDTSVGGFALCR